MPADMKETIAEAAKRLLVEKHVKKLTVKDIVEECQITRQAFYYHFEDVPALFRWALERETDRMLQEVQTQSDPEQRLKYFFLVAINGAPYLKKGMQGSYRDEFERLLTQCVYRLFEQVIEKNDLYPGCTHAEVRLILRYHSQAVIGLLREWTEEDTRRLDQIVHLVYLLMLGRVSPLGGAAPTA
ncbi:MAG TPA: TetR/AcrR family transcriptional regulator [Candidatus Gemmiger faecigallinarum]|nr:TetR/AcrR family transcriptional regulator [Candidatus Gemmiger faecigallinarum]